MKKLLSIYFGIFVGIFTSYAQITEKKDFKNFTSIKVDGIIKVLFTKADTFSVVLSAEENMLKKITVKQEANELSLSMQSGNYINKKEVVAKISAPFIESINVSGLSSYTALDTTKEDKLKIKVSDISESTINVNTKNLEIEVSDNSKLTINGTCDILTAKVSGSSKLVSSSMSANQSFITIEDLSSLKMNLTSNETNLFLQDNSSATLKGETQLLKAELSGMSSLKGYNFISQNVDIKANSLSKAEIFVNKNLTAKAFDMSSIKYRRSDTVIATTEAKGDSKVEELKEVAANDSTNSSTFVRSKVFGIVYDKNQNHSDNDEQEFYSKTHWSGITLFANGYLDSKNSTTPPKGFEFLDLDYSKSFGWGINFADVDINLAKNKLFLVTGLGLHFHNYRFQNNTTLRTDTNYIAAFTDTLVTFKKNTLKTFYITAPLLFEFNTSNKTEDCFHFAIGAMVGYKLGSKTKQVFEQNNKQFRLKLRDDYNLSPFKLDAVFGVGYGNFTIFSTYSISEMFQKNKGPKLYPFTIGILIG